MRAIDISVAERIGRQIDASPTPFHVVGTAVGVLDGAGGRRAASVFDCASPGLWYRDEGGSLVAWRILEHHTAKSGFRIVGAHTDSPNLRIKPIPDRGAAGYEQLGVEVYGGVLLNSWLDRDLGLAGRVAVRDGTATREQLVVISEPLLRLPQLAIHLDRDVNEKGLVLNRQQHLSPVWGLGQVDEGSFSRLLGELAETEPEEIVGFDMMAFAPQPSSLLGRDRSMLSASRIDNQLSCFAAVQALVDIGTADRVAMVCLFDHEEVGSISATGAGSPTLQHAIDAIAAGFDADADALATSRGDSIVLSADGAHATHPNYVDRHEPEHRIALNGGPVLKINVNQRYATDARTGAAFRLACERAEVSMQEFVNRSDLACGSTIGPITAGQLGIGVVDGGCAQLAMHSIRELCGAHDPGWFEAAIFEFLRG